VLVEDLVTFMPGDAAVFHAKLLNPAVGDHLAFAAALDGERPELTPFEASGDELVATLERTEARWIHYFVCVTGSHMCSPVLVAAAPTTTKAFATSKTRLVPETFMVPPPPAVQGYVWHILEPEILKQDYQFLMDQSAPLKITLDEDYGELKRHRWEFQHQSAFAYGILTPDGKEEVACVYVNPSKKQGFDAMVKIWVGQKGAQQNLEPLLKEKVREWMQANWPFKKVAYPGGDISMSEWNGLPDAVE
jgi:hypothetical protein